MDYSKTNYRNCIICSFLPLNDEHKKLWSNVNRILVNHNVSLILISSFENNSEFEFPVIRVPTFLHQFNEEFDFEKYSTKRLDEADFLLIERDMFWSNVDEKSYLNHYKGYIKCVEFYTSVIEYLKPDLVFIWGNYLAQSEIFKKLLDKHGIQNYYLERGYLTGTIMIEDLLLEKLKLQNDKTDELDDEVYCEIKNFYTNTKLSKYPVENNGFIEKQIELIKNEKKIISFFPNPDHALFPREHCLSKEISPLFSSHVEMAYELSKYVDNSNDLFLIIKTHPLDNIDKYRFLESENVLITNEIFYKDLFKYSDILIFSTSTLQYEALLYDKPILILSNTALKYCGFPYVINNKNEIIILLKRLLSGNGNYNASKHAKEIIKKILDNYTFFYINDFPNQKRLEDFCEFIIKKVNSKDKDAHSLMDLISFQSFINLHSTVNNQKKCVYFDNEFNLVPKCNEFKEKLSNYYKQYNGFIEEKIERGELFQAEQMINGINNFSSSFNLSLTLMKLNEKRNELKIKNEWSAKISAKLLFEAEKLIGVKKYKEAKKILMKILNMEPTHVEALNDYAVLNVLMNNIIYAKKIFQEVLKLEPTNEIAQENLHYIEQKFLNENQYINNKLIDNTKQNKTKNTFQNKENYNNIRSLKFINREHRRYWWYKLKYNDFIPICYSFLNDEEWSIVEEWFEESERMNLIGEAPVPFISFLLGLIMGNKIDRIVQLGTYAGFSSLMLGFMLRKMNVKNGFISFDIDHQSTEFAQKFIDYAGLNEYVNLQISDSTKIETIDLMYEYFNGKRPKLVIIDSSHQKEQTIKELNLWYEHLLKGGMMIFHDSSEFAMQWDATQKGGVKTALDEWCKYNTHVKFINIYNEPDSLKDENYVYQDLNGIAIIQK